MAEPPILGPGDLGPITNVNPPRDVIADWTIEQVRAYLRAATDPETAEEFNKVTQVIAGLANGTYWKNHEKARGDILKDLKDLFVKVATLIGESFSTVANSIYGVDIEGGSLSKIASGGGSAGVRFAAGDAIVKQIMDIFDTQAVKAGYQARLPGSAEQGNWARFVGVNWQLQMADLIAEFASKWAPWDIAGATREIGEHIQKILGLEDAQEEIFEPIVEKLIVAGLEKRFNRETKPTDYPPADAIQLHIQGKITRQVLDWILDNEGFRDDIRDNLIALRAKDLTEADARDLLERGIWDASALKAFFVSLGYLDADAQRKADLVAGDRKWKLKNELLTVKESQFVAGVLDEGSFRNYLVTMSFSQEEEDIEIEIVKGKASLTATGKPKQITGTFNVAPWRVRPGNTALMSWNIRNATDITISGIGSVPARGERVITPDISQTYVLTATSDTDSERFEAVVQVGDTRELKRPTASFSASPGRIQMGTPVELKWSTGNADSVSIDGIGQVSEAGAMPVFPFLSTIYTLRATNAQGTTVRQDIVFVELPDIDLDRERRPSISFSITPGVVKASQPQAELNWSISRADEGRLTFPDGSTQNVSRNGAMIVTATASGIYTLRANNAFGETRNQEALIFQGADEEQP